MANIAMRSYIEEGSRRLHAERDRVPKISSMAPLQSLAGLALCAVSHAAVLSQFSAPGRLTGDSFGIPFSNQTYDYIVIGGGLAGSVVASRLTENSNATVAIIEAGSFYELSNGNYSQIPYFSTEWVGADLGPFNPLIDWGLDTIPQANGESMRYAQGRNLGGSSGRNQMLYHRPTKGYYEQFADHVGDAAWTWDNMTQYLERSMTFTPPLKNPQASSISYDASAFLPNGNMSNPLQVTYPGYAYELAVQHAPAVFESIGLSSQPGLSSGVLHGYSYWTYTIDPTTGTRSSAEASFLYEALERDTLTVYINSLAQNVVFNGTRAVGVNVTTPYARDRFYTLSARKEVIVAAGAWHSPQILMLSGIGPNATLAQHNIPVKSALEGVGQNMWDSTNIGGPTYQLNDTITTFQEIRQNKTMFAQAVEEFRSSGTGPLTQIGSDIVAWYKIPRNMSQTFSNATQQHLASLASDWPELEIQLTTSSSALSFGDDMKKVGSIANLMVGTAGRGNMTIRSNSIFDTPIINPNWLRDPRDQEVAVAAYRLARQAWEAVPDGVRIGQEIFPGANVTSDADLIKAITGNIAAIHHASASCAMGRADNPMAVVDSRGRVFGVQGLRVVDSSALPFTPPGHTQGVTYGHAEKMAAVILEDM